MRPADNARPDTLLPFISALYRYNANTTGWRAWDDEIVGVQTDAAPGTGATVWRFAHHRSDTASDLDPTRIGFWYTPRPNISPDGRWALFTSNWEKTLGTDPAGESSMRASLALNCTVQERSRFARKNYFYPDLPKGYQISQYELPLATGGWLDIEVAGATKRIGITRAHLEEDAGKSLHEGLPGMTGIDLNRAGTPLVEIVSEPDMRSAKEAVAYMKKMHTLVRYLEISDGNMHTHAPLPILLSPE